MVAFRFDPQALANIAAQTPPPGGNVTGGVQQAPAQQFAPIPGSFFQGQQPLNNPGNLDPNNPDTVNIGGTLFSKRSLDQFGIDPTDEKFIQSQLRGDPRFKIIQFGIGGQKQIAAASPEFAGILRGDPFDITNEQQLREVTAFIQSNPDRPIGRQQNIIDAINRFRSGQTAKPIEAAPVAPKAPESIVLPGASPTETTETTLGDISLGPAPTEEKAVESVEELIEMRRARLRDILTGSFDEAGRREEAARLASIEELNPFVDLAAQREQEALLGTRGAEAQQAAIGGLPISAFQAELDRRQRQAGLRRAAAQGELGSGATIQEQAQLAGSQQAANIQRRLAQLDPLARISRSAAGEIARLQESGLQSQAERQRQLGQLLANLETETATPLTQADLQEAQQIANERIRLAEQTGKANVSATELRGLKDIARAQQQGALLSSAAGLAGQFAPQIQSGFSGFFSRPQSTANLQAGQNALLPQAGLLGIA